MKKLKYLLLLALFIPVTVFGLDKQELIFSNLDYTGKIKSIKVTNHIKNSDDKKIDDNSTLEEILNVNGDEKFTKTNDNITWETSGKDIIYRGKTNKALPITTKIAYYLDGKKTDLKKIIGKKGHVEIKLTFENTDEHSILVNRKYKTMYTPFVTTVGTILDTKDKNIEVTNGKVVGNGKNNVLVALATPGLYQSTGIKYFKNMNSVKISFDTNKFSLKNIYVVSTPKILDEVDLKVFDKLDAVGTGIDQLKDGSNTLESELKKAINTLDDKSDALNEEQINTIKDTAKKGIEDKEDDIKTEAWDKVKEELAKSTDDTIKNYTINTTKAIINPYFNGDEEKINASLGCVNELSEGITDGPICQAFMSLEKDMELFKKDFSYVSYVLLNLGNLSNQTTYYIAEKISKNVSYNTSLNVASEVSETVSKSVANTVKNTIMSTMKDKMTLLYDGVVKLNDGINTIHSYKDKIYSYKNTFDALKDLSNTYQGFTSNNSSKVIFISKVESKK